MLIYLHVPFCARRCSYCDFAIAVRREIPSAAFAEAILTEWGRRAGDPGWSQSPGVETVYFGGGTPSKLDPGALGTILDRIRADRGLSSEVEITVEANPEDVTDRVAAAWAALGVNRVSLGVQSFSPPALEWMHRTHTAGQETAAVERLRQAGITNLSLDLIYGLPETVPRDWAEDLDRALELEPGHLSLYGLTVEAATPLWRWAARGEVAPASDDRAAEQYLLAHARLSAEGYRHYEVSNAGLPGRESRHNLGYWQRKPFLGLGPSAFSAQGAERSWNLREWEAWRRAMTAGHSVEAGQEVLDPSQVRLEELYLGLRTDSGVEAARIPEADRARWLGQSWATEAGTRVRLTPEGWLRLDALVASLPDGF